MRVKVRFSLRVRVKGRVRVRVEARVRVRVRARARARARARVRVRGRGRVRVRVRVRVSARWIASKAATASVGLPASRRQAARRKSARPKRGSNLSARSHLPKARPRRVSGSPTPLVAGLPGVCQVAQPLAGARYGVGVLGHRRVGLLVAAEASRHVGMQSRAAVAVVDQPCLDARERLRVGLGLELG